MMILMTQGGWGVQNWPKVDDVIYERSLATMLEKGNIVYMTIDKFRHQKSNPRDEIDFVASLVTE